MAKEHCSRRVYHGQGSWGHDTRCSNPAKVQRDGEWYCGVHDPERLRALSAKHDERRRAEDAERERRQRDAWIRRLREQGYTVIPPADASEEGR